MAVDSMDAQLRNSPVVNKVAGYNAIARPSDFVKAKDDKGGFHKLRTTNRNDWLGRGSGFSIVGPWTEADEEELRDTIAQHKHHNLFNGPIEGVYAAQAPSARPLLAPQAPAAKDEDAPVQPPKAGGTDPAYAKMLALRAELVAGGVKVNDQWGMNRLQNEVDGLHKRLADAAPSKAAGGAPSGVSAPQK